MRVLFMEIGVRVVEVFGSCERFAAWCAICPGNNESAGKRRSASVRHGNSVVRNILVECVQAAAHTNGCQAQGYHKALMIRCGYKRATVATARNLARCVFAVLRDRRPYVDSQANF